MKNICIVTGTRAEYGLLKPLIRKVMEAEELTLNLVVTGMHLSPEFGMTVHEIEKDNFPVDARIEMLLGSDTPGGTLKSMGIELVGFADYLTDKKIDMMVVLGDRYEIFIAAASALFYGIPIAHIHGGETTEGAVDEALRHSITKMSTLHFAATQEYKRRIIQLGEQPERVFNVGSLGIENIRKVPLMTKKETEDFLGFSVDQPVLIVTYHPVTLEDFTAEKQMKSLLSALDCYPECRVIFTKANSDMGGRIINQMIDEYVGKNQHRCMAFTSMGQVRYFSVLQFCMMAVGNSSSGLIEVPSFHIPTINIGDRQKGRLCADSVIHCGNSTEEISQAMEKGFLWIKEGKLREIQNPYEKADTSDAIMEKIVQYLSIEHDRKKHFYDLP